MHELVLATSNKNKHKEIQSILEGSAFKVCLMNPPLDVEETGDTFAANAIIKAEAVMRATGKAALADDSGLEIDHLNGAPGVQSARFCGYDTPYSIKNARILELMAGVPDTARTARFVCAIAVAFPDGRLIVEQAALEGLIAHAPAGNNGFGYDPIFHVPHLARTTAQLDPHQKNKISHRGQALKLIGERIKTLGLCPKPRKL